MDFPKPIYLGQFRFYWRIAELEAWEVAQAKRSAASMTEVTVHRRPQGRRWDRRGLLFGATARYGDLRL